MEGISKGREGGKEDGEEKLAKTSSSKAKAGERLCERTNRRRERERITRRHWLHATFGIIQQEGESLLPLLSKFLGQWMRQL